MKGQKPLLGFVSNAIHKTQMGTSVSAVPPFLPSWVSVKHTRLALLSTTKLWIMGASLLYRLTWHSIVTGYWRIDQSLGWAWAELGSPINQLNNLKNPESGFKYEGHLSWWWATISSPDCRYRDVTMDRSISPSWFSSPWFETKGFSSFASILDITQLIDHANITDLQNFQA